MSKVPEGWERLSIREVTSLITKGATPTTYGYDFIEESSDSVIFIGAYNCSFSGTFKSNSNKWICQDANLVLKRSMLKADDTIFCIVGNTIGSSFKVSEEIIPANINQNVALIRPSSGFVDSDYLHYWMRSSYIQMQVGIEASVQAQPSLSLKQIGEFGINLPPLPEQTKIAQILSTWDKAIATNEKLIGNSQQQKKALMQSLLTGNKRLPGFEGEWIPFAVERFLTLRKEKFNPKLSEERNICIELEHIEQGAGVLNGTSITNNQMSDKSRFYTGDILFGKLRPYLRKYWFADFSGVCSTEIWVFKNQADKCLPEYLYQLIQTDHFIDGTNISSGTHMPRADWKVVKDIIFKLPPLPEQQKIAAVLTAADNEIELLQKKLALLKQEKAALMQQLLTGKRRVKVEAA